LVEDTESDWWMVDVEDEPEPQLRELPLTSTYEYDDWGEQRSVKGPDDVWQFAETDPIRQTTISWVQSNDTAPLINNQIETRSNRFGKPEWARTLDAGGNLVGQIDYVYDGLGRCIQKVNALGQSTGFTYDAWSRLVGTTLPDQTFVEKGYAPHSSNSLPTSLHAKADKAPESILLGEQHFDGLDRATQLKTGPRITTFTYKGGQMQVDESMTAGNHSMKYHYSLGLTEQPIRIIAEDEQTDFTYDFKTAELLSSQNSLSRTEFDYNLNGQLTAERRVEEGVTWETRHTASFGGRALSRQEPGGLTTLYDYDDQGRIRSVKQGQLQAEFTWSSLGRVQNILTTDSGSGTTLQTGLQYNDQGQETERTLELSGHDTRIITQTWRKDGKLISRHLKTQDRSLLDETFDYDERGRLVLHDCSGATLPQDAYGHGISEQHFEFDALDNIIALHSVFDDGSTDEAAFGFADDDPTQLVGITHTHPAYPASITLDYDANGNLLHDENAQQLTYDTQSRLLSVTATDGSTAVQYRYDAHNQLVGVTPSGRSETLRFYKDQRLSSILQDNIITSYLYGGDQPLGQQTQGDDSPPLLLMTDAKQSVIGESQKSDLRTAVYSAYGGRSSEEDLRNLLGFNGEVRDEVSGWYLLGRGYRAYNPTLMRFHSPDSLSPFGAGGLNPYVYCLGDPIGFVDPTGHMSRGLFLGLNIAGLVLGIIGTVATGGLVAPMLTLQFGLSAVAQTAGVAAVITGSIGIYTPDLQAKKVLGWVSTALGIVSLLAGLATVATGTSKWLNHTTSGISNVDDANNIIPRHAAEAIIPTTYRQPRMIFQGNRYIPDSNTASSITRTGTFTENTSTQTDLILIPRTELANTVRPPTLSNAPPPPPEPGISLPEVTPPTPSISKAPSSTPLPAKTSRSPLPDPEQRPAEFIEWINRTKGDASLSGKTYKPGNVRALLKNVRRLSI
ncbi:RHS repeat-associated core domain-containing protein, partial [Pseudomonas lijiangensis]